MPELTPEQLAEIRLRLQRAFVAWANKDIDDLLAHIEAQDAKIAALEAERDTARKCVAGAVEGLRYIQDHYHNDQADDVMFLMHNIAPDLLPPISSKRSKFTVLQALADAMLALGERPLWWAAFNPIENKPTCRYCLRYVNGNQCDHASDCPAAEVLAAVEAIDGA